MDQNSQLLKWRFWLTYGSACLHTLIALLDTLKDHVGWLGHFIWYIISLVWHDSSVDTWPFFVLSYSLLHLTYLLQGAFWGIVTGHVCGICRMILDFIYPAPACGEVDTRPLVVSQLHYTYFSQLNVVLTILVIIGVSLMTGNKDQEVSKKLGFFYSCKVHIY